MKTQGEHIRALRRRVDFLAARNHKNSYDQAELGALEWALVNLPPAQPEQEPDKYLYRVDVSRRKDNNWTEYDHPIYFHSKADANNYCWTINQAPYPQNTIVVAKFVDIKIAPFPPKRKWVRESFEAWFKRTYHTRLDRNMPDKSYNDPHANATWLGWSAAHNLKENT
jgi:hypothetical protein